MAGRGRGRGRGSMSFSVETLGFGRGEALPTVTYQPPPLFPPLEFKPCPLATGEEYEYLLALKQEYRGTVRESPFYIKPLQKKRDIERYSDKYQVGQGNGNSHQPDWSRVPAELKITAKKRPRVKAVIKPKLVPHKNKEPRQSTEDVQKTLEELEKIEEVGTAEGGEEEEEEKEKEEGEEEEVNEEEYYEEDDLEEETDYNLNYFDNGEDDGMGEDDDLDEGPVY